MRSHSAGRELHDWNRSGQAKRVVGVSGVGFDRCLPGLVVLVSGQFPCCDVVPGAVPSGSGLRVGAQVPDPRGVSVAPGVRANDGRGAFEVDVGDQDLTGFPRLVADRHEFEDRHAGHGAPDSAARRIPHQLVQSPPDPHRRAVGLAHGVILLSRP